MRFLLIFSLCLTGCAALKLARPVDRLNIRTPGSWAAVSTGNDRRISTGWLATLGDRELTRTVDEALANNRDLKAASARLREAKENSIIAQSRLKPLIGFSGAGGLSDTSDGPRSQNYSVNLAASWEPDLWRRLRDLTRAAGADEQAAVEDFRGARLSLAANTAKAWCNLISAQQEVALAGVTLQSFEKNLRIIERNYKSTGEGALDIQFGRTNVSSAQRSLDSTTLNRDEAARSLELLLGRYPAAAVHAGKDLPELPGTVPAGIPAELIERRPDLSAARARLFASAGRADAARKSLLPSFSLTGSLGTPTSRFTDLLGPGILTSAVTARFNQVITDGGALSAGARASLARNEALLHDYAQTALEGFREVESTLAADRSLANQERFLATELEQAALAEKQAERDYSQGVNTNILSVLEAQRRANNARANRIRLRNQRLQNRINLHLALGGDFSTNAK